jgi:ribosome biogenesis protein MAK21
VFALLLLSHVVPVMPEYMLHTQTLLAVCVAILTTSPLSVHVCLFCSSAVQVAPKGTSLMQPSHSLTATAAAGSTAAAALAAAAGSIAADMTSLGPNAFADLAETEIAPDQLFFHKFFNLGAVKSKAKAVAAAKAAKAAAAAAGGGSDGGSDDEDSDGGELGRQGIESDEDFESEEVERALADAEGVEDDGLGDPDVDYDYEQVLAAMAAASDGSDGGGSGGEDGSSDGGEEAANGSGSGSDGGSSDSGSCGEEGESEEEDWVMLEGAAVGAAAAANGVSKQKRKHAEAAGKNDVLHSRFIVRCCCVVYVLSSDS